MPKEITAEDFSNFCDDFAEEHPELDLELPSKAFMNGKILCNQPAAMTNERWAEFMQYKENWLKKNGFL